MLSLTPRSKGTLDAALGLLGAFFGILVSQAGNFGDKAPYVALAGGFGGYFVSDLITFVNTGQAPAPAVIQGQASALWTQARPTVTAQILKLPASEQAAANLALTLMDKYLAPQTSS